MVRLLHARQSGVVDAALTTATSSNAPFLLLVYSDRCGHCVRMMPAFHQMLTGLGHANQSDVVQLASDALNTTSSTSRPHPLRSLIQSKTNGVPYLAVVSPSAVGPRFIPLPETNDRSASSLTAFAKKHLAPKKINPKVQAPRPSPSPSLALAPLLAPSHVRARRLPTKKVATTSGSRAPGSRRA